ncbi:MAG: B12-binding domain-containing protein, partial [Actinomycetes bacterium]
MPHKRGDQPKSLIDDYLHEYLSAAKTGQRRAAVDIAVSLLGQGFSGESIIMGLLARSQAAVGVGWMEGRLSVATEHRASEITESALAAVTEAALRAPTAPIEGSAGRVIVACSEGEWHIMPARMMCEILRLRGAEISFVGPLFPANEIGLLFQTDPAEVVAVTCSLPSSLPGAWRTISALRSVGMR